MHRTHPASSVTIHHRANHDFAFTALAILRQTTHTVLLGFGTGLAIACFLSIVVVAVAAFSGASGLTETTANAPALSAVIP